MKSKRSPDHDLENLIPILIGAWRRFHKQAGPPDVLQTREFRSVVAAIKQFQGQYDSSQSILGQNYFEKPELIGAYLLYYWVIHYQEGLSLIGELPSPPRRVVDICSGPAPMAFAALKHGAQEVFALDQNEPALKLGAEVCGRYGFPISIRPWNCLTQPFPLDGKFDLIILGHCLNELFPPSLKNRREIENEFIGSLLNRLTPQGFLLITENSFSEANNHLLQLRDRLVKEGVPVQAPCVWQGECPALKVAKSPCYAQREMYRPFVIKEIQRAAQINLGSLKMSYVIFRSPRSKWPEVSQQKLYRVISPPVEAFQGKRFYLCGTDGKKSLGSRLDTHPLDSRAFEFLRRGELISIEGALEKDNTFEVIQGTKISVEAACGKPVIEKLTES